MKARKDTRGAVTPEQRGTRTSPVPHMHTPSHQRETGKPISTLPSSPGREGHPAGPSVCKDSKFQKTMCLAAPSLPLALHLEELMSLETCSPFPACPLTPVNIPHHTPSGQARAGMEGRANQYLLRGGASMTERHNLNSSHQRQRRPTRSINGQVDPVKSWPRSVPKGHQEHHLPLLCITPAPPTPWGDWPDSK